ncbi:PAS domain-containing protein [Sulfurimonas sp. HSL1-2]|uniref:PAS domain-containing protein n=1 Tax=Thiomicrolovo zhangzhouensis TaxID=3131933 RepID=UPI0031F80F7A
MQTSFAMFRETEVPEDELIISRTDLKGIITYANDTFADISGYTPEELVGQPHNILRHPDMPKSAFRHMWETLKAGKAWEGYVKNRRKDDGYYWVYARVSGVFKNGELIEYKSLRSYVPHSKRYEMQNVYDAMRQKEGDSVRIVGYFPTRTYEKMLQAASDAGISPEEWLANQLN